MKGIEDSGNNKNKNGIGDGSGLRKGPWMPEEDEILVEYVRQYGPRDWSSIRTKGLLPRTGKSCRLRWVNKLKPDLKSGCKFSPEEEKVVVEMQAKLGNKWAKIASYLPGRTDNDVKNFWSTRQKRIMRALQRPKSAPLSADHASFHVPNLPSCYLSDFPGLEVENATPLQTIATGCPFPEQQMDDMVMVKLGDLVGGGSLLTEPDLVDGIPPLLSDDISQGSAMSSTAAYSSPKSKRKRPCPWDIKDFDTNKTMRLPMESVASYPLGSLQSDGSSQRRDYSVDLYMDPNDLDFLLQPQPLHFTTPDLGIFPCPHQDDVNMNMNMNVNVKKEETSCTPETVLATFATDVFDSLEPLASSPSAADWWEISRFNFFEI